ncbi:MAG: hypothetical protein HC877_13230 [Thioploca sp.]|nr:hypothetical protein [Thioploca sp.]
MNPADKTVQELTQSLNQSEQTIQQLTEILSKSEKRSQWLERTFRWLAILFICLTMMGVYIGFDWINKAQATSQLTNAPAETPETVTPHQAESNSKEEIKYQGQRQSCQQGMQLMMVKQAQDLLVTSLTLNKEIQQIPQSPEKDQIVSMNNELGKKLSSFFPNMDNIFNDNSRIACDTFVQIMNITRKLEQFKADWNIVRKLLLKALRKTEKDEENKSKLDQENRQDPLYPVAKIILDYLRQESAIKTDRETPVKNKEFIIDSALASYLASGVMKGIASLNILGEIQQALRAVPKMDTSMKYMNANMEDMNTHMYYMMKNMGVMTHDMDSTLGRAGRNMPWMPW